MLGAGRRKEGHMCKLVTAVALAVALLTPMAAATRPPRPRALPIRTLNGSGNNLRRPAWGESGTQYVRLAAPNYADGISKMVAGPPARYVSNRIFNDVGQNLFSENGISQWGWVWAQFVDHDIGLRDETPAERVPIMFNARAPLEVFRNDLGAIDFARTPAAPGTGRTSPRQQLNTISSYIDGSGIYSGSETRLAWLRDGPRLLLTRDGYLPRADARGNVATAPPMDLIGRLAATPARAVVAGDVRANENIALTALHTLFAREHNRIVALLPRTLADELKFEIARRVVGAELQYVTYHEFLPALGVRLSRYRGYDPRINPGLSNEFAVVGYRAHSMIHGEFDVAVSPGAFSPAQLAAFRAQGLAIEPDGKQLRIDIPLNVAFGNPDLLHDVGIGTVLGSFGERQYKNDEQIDNALRSVLFQVPKPGVANPSACGEPIVSPSCFTGVQDLGAIDIERGRDHGMPSYNDLRRAYGLSPRQSFAGITGEATSAFPTNDPKVSRTGAINDPDILDFVELKDRNGEVLDPDGDEAGEEAVSGKRRTTLAARLRATYGSVDKVDAFVGMVAEPHLPGSELGPLQTAIWRRQFQALRDGDRYFYRNDPELARIQSVYGISARHTLADLIQLNAGVEVEPDVFRVVFEPAAN
jgi:Animal haem peroxidase